MSDYCMLFSQTFYGLLFSYLTITDVTSYVDHTVHLTTLLQTVLQMLLSPKINSCTLCVPMFLFSSPFPNLTWTSLSKRGATILMKMSLVCSWIKFHFHMKGRAARLGLRKRLGNGRLEWAYRKFLQHTAWFIAPVNPQEESCCFL